MSIVEEFNYVDSTKSDKIENEIEVTEKKRKISDDMEISSSDDDDDSLADSPVDGIERYKLDFQNVIEGVFGEKSSEGSNHIEFVEEVKSLISTVEYDNEEQIYTHVICNQYAKARGVKNGNSWEKLDNMWELYKSGKLTRFKYRCRKYKKSKYNFQKTKVVLTDEEEEEEEEEEKGFYAFQILEKHKLSHFTGLESILDTKASISEKAVKSVKRIGMHLFEKEDLLESFLAESALEFLKTNKSFHVVSKKKSFENVPQEITSYCEYGGKQEGDQPEDRVRWIDDVFEDDLEFNIEGHPNCERILLKLEAQNSNRAVKQIAMKCGSLFIQRYKRQPLEKDEEGRNIYRNCHLAAMKDIYNKVKSQYIK